LVIGQNLVVPLSLAETVQISQQEVSELGGTRFFTNQWVFAMILAEENVQ